MSTPEAASIWSLFAPSGAAAPALRTGRAEEGQESGRFAAALEQARAAGAAPSDTAARQAMAGNPRNPEDIWSEPPPGGGDFFGEDGFGLGDLLDIVNPLQHLPVVSSIYREMTGDEISPGARLAGGALYGGPAGFVGALANTVSEDVSGDDIGGNVMTALLGDTAPANDAGTATAAANRTAGSSADPTAEQLAQIAPAAGPVGTATPTGTAAQTSPFFASQPSGAPFAALPQSAGPLFAATPVNQPTVAGFAPLPPAGQTLSGQTLGGQNPGADSPAAATAQAIPQLSPETAEILMRMSQQTQAAPIQTTPTQTTQAQTTQAQTTRAQAVVPPPAETAAASPPEEFEPVASEDLSAAMMAALAKYEDMKRGQ